MNWSGKRVLVTGAGGFIGSHLTEALVQRGAQVTAFVHYNALGRDGWLDETSVRNELNIVRGHIEDSDYVHKAMTGADVVMHLAALIAIPYSYHAPRSYVRTNIEGTLNVLQSAQALEVGRVVHTSTSEVYGSARYAPIDENHPIQGQSPYSATKAGADKLAEAFHLSFDLPVVTVRPFNTFGPRQSVRAVIPTIVLQLLRGSELRLGATHPTRDFTFVSDTVEGFIKCAESEQAIGQVVNLGTGREVAVGDLAQLIAQKMSRPIALKEDEARIRPDASEVQRLCADNRKALELTGWAPSVSLEDGVAATIEWFRAHQHLYSAGAYQL